MENGFDYDRIREMFKNSTKDDVVNCYSSLRDDYEYMRKDNLSLKQEVEIKNKELFHIKRLNERLLKERRVYRGTPRVPVLFVRDKTNGKIHAVGSIDGDSLHIDEGGQYIYYENEEYGVGTELLQEGNKNSQPYEFVNFDPATKTIDEDDRCSTIAKVIIKEEK